MSGGICPVCNDEYHDMSVVSTDSRFENQYSGAFFDLMTTYRRRCSSRRDVEERRYVNHDQIVCYFHAR